MEYEHLLRGKLTLLCHDLPPRSEHPQKPRPLEWWHLKKCFERSNSNSMGKQTHQHSADSPWHLLYRFEFNQPKMA